MILFFFLVASSLPLSPVLSSTLLYDQKASNVKNAQIDIAGDKSSSLSFPVLPNVAFAQTDNAGDQSWPSLSLFSNVAFAQTPESESQPSDSFSLTVLAVCPGPGGSGTTGDDNIVGTDNADSINGGNGNDNIQGCGGNDNLNGNNGNDVIDGGEGDDKVFGNNNDDTLTGGPGADEFQCGNGDDTITDYTPSEGDTIVDADDTNCEDITLVGPIPPPEIDQPDTQDCEGTIEITGTAHPDTDTVNLFIQGGDQIGSTNDIDDTTGAWTISLDPNDPNLGNGVGGTFTLVATAVINGQESEDSESVTLEIDCPLPTPTINQPDTIIDCDNTFTVTGGFEGGSKGATETIILYQVIPDSDPVEIGRTSTIATDGSWEITGLDPLDFLGPNEDQTTITVFARAIQDEEGEGEEFTDSAQFTITIDCPLPTPTITEPSTVTNCDTTFDVKGGLTGEPKGAVETIILYKQNEDNTLTEIGRTSTIAADGSWSITLDPNDSDLGEGTFTIVAQGVQNEGEENEERSELSEAVTLEIDCPAAPTTIDDPADGTTTECESPLTVSGTFDSSTFNSVEIFVDGNSAGFAELNGDTWTFTIPAEFLGEGTHTIVAEASTGGSEPFTSQSDPITVTAECPPPPDGGGGGGTGGGGTGGGAGGAGGGTGGGAGGGGAGGGGAAGSAVTNVQRSIFRVPYTEIECVQSVVELREDLIPTTDFPAVVEEVKSQNNITVLNVWNVPEYKAMLLAEGDEEKLADDARFLPAEATCGEIILEAVLPANIHELAQDVISQYHVKVVDIIDIPEYKAIVILAEPDNPITKDPRFVNYNEDYQLSENYTGSGELNLKYGHIAAPPTVIEEEIRPDSIKRTFSAEELEEDSQSEDGNKTDVDVDIAILDTGIDLDHPDLNVYKDFSVIGINQTGDDDQGHGSHVAGIAAAKDNGIGVIGGAPGARLWSVKVCDSEGKCKISDMIKGVQYVTEHADEIDVANISVETPLSPALNRAISASIKAGVTFVVAAGNYGQDASLTSPASSPDVITVSAIADTDGKCGGEGPAPDIENATDDTFAPFSNFGPSVSIAAPGVSVLSTYLDGEYAVDSGTSMASPSVAAAAALLKANSTDMTPKEIKDNLLDTGSTPLTPCQGGPQGYFSGDPDDKQEPLLFRK